ncbi:co-chaperone YbbN [Micrococcus lylae]|uniref:co-chaperone YbbN n=1 Tax=Micrococcus lylae TaxID=1273 RepID=UPI003EB7A35D
MSIPHAEQPSGADRLRGAVDLSSLAAPGTAPGGGPGASAPGTSSPAAADAASEGSWVIEQADQQVLQQLVQLSAQVPVVVLLHVPGDETSEQLHTQFADAVDGQAGRLVMGRVDVAAEPQLLQAFGLQAGPAVLALVAGQPVPLANQVLPADALEKLVGEIQQVARQNGVSGQVPPVAPARAGAGQQAPATPVPPLHRQAQEALAAGDWEAAVGAWEKALNDNPADTAAQQGLASAKLMRRTADMDAAAVRQAGAENPDDVAAQAAVADLDLLGGHVEDAFQRLVRFIALHPGEDREPARAHLVDLYTVVGSDDPRVQASRRKLASALF